MINCAIFRQKKAFFGRAMMAVLGILFILKAEAAPLCAHVLLHKAPPISDAAALDTIRALAKFQLQMDLAMATGNSMQKLVFENGLPTHQKNIAILIERLSGRMTAEEVKNAIRREIAELQNEQAKKIETRNKTVKEELQILEFPKDFVLDEKKSARPFTQDQIPYRSSTNRHDQVFMEYLPKQKAFLSWDSFRDLKILNLDGSPRSVLLPTVLAAAIVNNKVYAISYKLELKIWDLATLENLESKKLKIHQSFESYQNQRHYRMSVSPSENRILLNNIYSDVRFIQIFDIQSGEIIYQKKSDYDGEYYGADLMLVSDTQYLIRKNGGLALYDTKGPLYHEIYAEVRLRSDRAILSQDFTSLSVINAPNRIQTFGTATLQLLNSKELAYQPQNLERTNLMTGFSDFGRSVVVSHTKAKTILFDQYSLEQIFDFKDKYSDEETSIIKIFYDKEEKTLLVVYEKENADGDIDRFVDTWSATWETK